MYLEQENIPVRLKNQTNNPPPQKKNFTWHQALQTRAS